MKPSASSITFEVSERDSGARAAVALQTPGAHNVSNALAALAAARLPVVVTNPRQVRDFARATIATGDTETGLADARRALHLAESSATYQAEADALRALAAGHRAKGEHRMARAALERSGREEVG